MFTKNPGLALAFAAPLAFSVFNAGIRFITEYVTVFGFLFLRGCIGIAVIAIVARFLKKTLWGRHGALFSAIGLSCFFATAAITTAITLIPLYQAMVILYLFPTWAIILSAIINKEKIQRGDPVMVALALFGCVLLIWPDEAAGLTLQIGHLIGILGSLAYALGYVLGRRLGAANSGLEPMFHYSLYCVLCSLPLAFLFGPGLGVDRPVEIAAGLALGALGTMAQVMSYAALRWLPAFKVGVIGTLEVLGGSLASYFLFNDPMNARAAVGGLIIVTVALWPRGKNPSDT